MRRPPLAAGFGLFLLLTAMPIARAEVTVSFLQADRYTDVGDYRDDAERNLQALARHLATLGTRCLAQDETLEFEIFDVDLAGRQEWWHRDAYDLRVMREVTWPRIDLRYIRRDAAGTVLDERREQVADVTYLWRSGYVRSDADALPYEKAMLRDWFERRFCRACGAVASCG